MKPTLTTLFVMLFLVPAIRLRAQVITTIAGTPTTFGFSGVGGAATSAVIGEPFNVAVDKAGNIYFTDPEHNYVFKVNTAGIISVFAGTGSFGHTGDGGPATSAKVQSPFWLTIDNAGNVYIGENTGSVRSVNTSGIISTLITAANASDSVSSGDGGPLSAATFMQITRFVPDNAGNFYISDFLTGVVRKVNSAGRDHYYDCRQRVRHLFGGWRTGDERRCIRSLAGRIRCQREHVYWRCSKQLRPQDQ